MKVYGTNEIKNIALIGSKGSGKTTLAEAMLYECGVIKRRGTVENGNTVCDYFPVEKEYGYTVFSTVCYAEFLNKKLNVIDCPGSDDFVGNAITALNVTDTGVLLIDAQYGVEVGTQNIFRVTENVKKPVIFAINQLDADNVDFENVVHQMKEVFGNKIVLVQYPINPGNGYNAMIDVLLMKMYSWGPEGGVPTISEIPADQMGKAQELNKLLVEAAAENDENLMEKFFDQGILTEDEMREGIRKGLADRSILPVFCVSALKDMGVRRMMEFLGNVVPFVNEMPKPVNKRRRSGSRPGRSCKPVCVQDFSRAAYRRGVVLQSNVGYIEGRKRPYQHAYREQGTYRTDFLRMRTDTHRCRRNKSRRHWCYRENERRQHR